MNPHNIPRVPIARPDLGPEERKNVALCLTSGWITQGPFVKEAEGRLREITGRKYAICVSSGTSALMVALQAIRPQAGPNVVWRVAAPALTFAAVHNAIQWAGGSVIRQPADLVSWQVPESEWQRRCWDAAIVAPCYGKLEGVRVAVDSARMAGYPLIEDAGESFGGHLLGSPAGSFGDISCISFYANKICTAGEGGAVLTDDPVLDRRLRTIANHGIANRQYLPECVGLNARMTDMQAAVLCAQLEKMPRMIERRNQIMNRYMEDAKNWQTGGTAPEEERAPWLFAGVRSDADYIWAECDRANIEVRPFFPIPLAVFSPTYVPSDLNPSRKLSRTGLCLPLSSALTDEEVERVAKVIRA